MMHDGRGKATWAHTSEILALLININRDRKRHPEAVKARDLNPYARPVKTPDVPKVSMKSLKGLLGGVAARKRGA